MIMLSNVNAMILMTDFEKDGGGGGEEDQKRFLELPLAKARQLKIYFFYNCFVKFEYFCTIRTVL